MTRHMCASRLELRRCEAGGEIHLKLMILAFTLSSCVVYPLQVTLLSSVTFSPELNPWKLI